MENAAEALKIAFGVVLFVIALTLSISCFSQATTAVTSIVGQRDRHIEYSPVTPSNGLTRIVGVETIVPTLYTALSQNIRIYFFESDGTTPLPLYYPVDNYGDRMTDEAINFFDLFADENQGEITQVIGNKGNREADQVKEDYLTIILGGYSYLDANDEIEEIYGRNNVYYSEGFYNYIKNKSFQEELGEYYQGSSIENGTGQTKRIITYTLVDDSP